MPKGVEHLKRLFSLKSLTTVNPSLMPKGVEHGRAICSRSIGFKVNPSLMPKGVEHPMAEYEYGPEAPGESLFDAERR